MKTNSIKGKNVVLIPLKTTDKDWFFTTITTSGATQLLFGPGTGRKIPDRKELFRQYPAHYFNDLKPAKGRCFAIEINNERIGQVNYDEIDSDGQVELNIWLISRKHQGKGFLIEALSLLTDYLFNKFNAHTFYINVIAAYKNALKSFRKAGFIPVGTVEQMGIVYVRMEKRTDPEGETG